MAKTRYYITFNSGKPEWNNLSKWSITADSRSEALHKANLVHDEWFGYEVAMVTISKSDKHGLPCGDVDEIVHHFKDLDAEELREEIEELDRIWQQKFNKLEDC